MALAIEQSIARGVREGEILSTVIALVSSAELSCKRTRKSLELMQFMYWISPGNPILINLAYLLGLTAYLRGAESHKELVKLAKDFYNTTIPNKREFCKDLKDDLYDNGKGLLAVIYQIIYYVAKYYLSLEERKCDLRMNIFLPTAMLRFISWRTKACYEIIHQLRHAKVYPNRYYTHILPYLDIVSKDWTFFTRCLINAERFDEAAIVPLLAMLRPGKVSDGEKLKVINSILKNINKSRDIDPIIVIKLLAGLSVLIVCHHKGLPPRKELAKTLAWVGIIFNRLAYDHKDRINKGQGIQRSREMVPQ